jgi:hypothetical protein
MIEEPHTGYCAVCGSPTPGDGWFRSARDGQAITFCVEHSYIGAGCTQPIIDGLSCALHLDHKGACRRIFREPAGAAR